MPAGSLFLRASHLTPPKRCGAWSKSAMPAMGFVIVVTRSRDGRPDPRSARMENGSLRLRVQGGAWNWDLHADKLLRDWPIPGGNGILSFSPDGRFLTSAVANDVRIWDADSGRLVKTFPWKASCAMFSPDGTTVWGSTPSAVEIRNRETRREIGRLIYGAEFAPVAGRAAAFA